MFSNLLGAVLGAQHTLTTTYRTFWVILSQGYRQELQQIVDHKAWLKPAHLLRSIQLICYNWFNQKKHRLTPTPPDFAILLQMITLNTYMLPWLPLTLHKLAYPRPGSLFQLPVQEAGSLTGSSGSTPLALRQSLASLRHQGLTPSLHQLPTVPQQQVEHEALI
jgi:hypothetical protein